MATNDILSDVFVKVRIILIMKRLGIKENARAARLLSLTLEDINAYGISHVSDNRQNKIKEYLRNALVFTYSNLNACAVKELKKGGLEIDMDDHVRKHLLLRDSDGSLNVLPYDIKLKIADYI